MGDRVFEAIFRDAAIGLILLDEEGSAVAVNPFARDLLGDDTEILARDAVAAALVQAAEVAEPVDVAIGFGLVARLTALRPLDPRRVDADRGSRARFVLVVGRAYGYCDSLTGLENREAGLSRLRHLLARRSPVGVELIFLDLDGFKEVNDNLGHQVGDEVLRCVAKRLVETVRPEDVVVRWGGDEFVVILEDPTEGSASHVCGRITAALVEPLTTSAGPVLMSASCGCAAGTNGDDPAELLHRADLRMYAEKRSRAT